jgi:hypothetical protein
MPAGVLEAAAIGDMPISAVGQMRPADSNVKRRLAVISLQRYRSPGSSVRASVGMDAVGNRRSHHCRLEADFLFLKT